jgi:hypothetical protein
MFDSSDIKYYLSGGTSNKLPNLSIGGLPSVEEVGNGLNNLFSIVSKQEIADGSRIFRCIYIANTGSSILEDTIVWLDQDTITTTLVGVAMAIEVQTFIIGGWPVGGSFSLRYTANVSGVPVSQDTNPISFVPQINNLASNIQNALNELDLLGDVSVSGSIVSSMWQLRITFGGSHSYRYHQILQIVDNNIVGVNVTTSISILTAGNPINGVASSIGFETQQPAEVEFSQPNSQNNAIPIGILEPSDIFGLWIMRTVSANTDAESDSVDDVTINLAAQT